MKLERWRGHTLAVVAAFVWSFTGPGLKVLLDGGAHPLALAFWRDAIMAAVCIIGLRVFRPDLLKVERRELLGLALAGMISIGIYHALFVWSIALNGAAVGIVLIYLFPTFVSIGTWLFFREPLRWPQIVALVVSLLGCALLVRMYDPAIFQLNWLGVIIGLLTALTHTVYVLYSQHSVQSRSPLTSLSYTMLFGTLTLMLILGAAAGWAVLVGDSTPMQVFSVGKGIWSWPLLIGLALGPTLGGYSIFTIALRYVPARIASLIVVIEAPIATLLAVWLVGERLEPLQIVGIGCILGAIVLPSVLERFVGTPLMASVQVDG